MVTYEELEKETRRYLVIAVGLFTATWLLLGILFSMVLAYQLADILGGPTGAPSLYFTTVLFYLVMGGASLTYYSAKSFTRLWLRVFGMITGPEPRIYPRVSIVIPAYNEEENIGNVLRALLSQDYPRDLLEVIIVDDGSADYTNRIVEYYRGLDPRIRLVRHRANLGKVKAIASGVAASSGDVIVILDADTLPDRSAIRRIVSLLLSKSNIGAVSGALIPVGSTGLLHKLQRIEYLLAFQIGRFFDEVVGGTNMILSGAFSAFRASLLKPILLSALSRLEETVAEDFDLTIRVWKKGMRTAYADDAVAYTCVPSRLRELYAQRIRWFSGGLQVLLQHLSLFSYRRPHIARRSARRLILHLLIVEYFLPILHVAGLIASVVLAIVLTLGFNILSIPAYLLLAALIASYIASTIMTVAMVSLSFIAAQGFWAGLKVLPYALLYAVFYLPLLSIAKTDSLVRVLSRMVIKWR